MAKFNLGIKPKDRKVGRFIGQVRTQIQKAFAEEAKERGLTQVQLADQLGVNRSVVNRRLKGNMNLTLRIIGELAWALGDREIVFELQRPQKSHRKQNMHSVDGVTEVLKKQDVHVGVY